MIDIDVKGLSFSYHKGANSQKPVILKDVTFTVESGESIGLIGANGVGKSTLLKLLVGIQLDYAGSLCIKGTDLKKENLEIIREKIGYVFQDSESQLFMTTVYEDIAFAPRNYGLSKAEVEKRTMEALERVHIEELKDQYIYRLSGGQKKMVSIGTIMSMRPDIILLDEPSAALDPGNRRNLIEILNELNVTKIIASHDLDFIYDTCDRTILLHEGKIIADGDTKDILTNKELLEKNGLELPLSFSRLKG
jgi:cobalt/nickel transport system ATP-binding protein